MVRGLWSVVRAPSSPYCDHDLMDAIGPVGKGAERAHGARAVLRESRLVRGPDSKRVGARVGLPLE